MSDETKPEAALTQPEPAKPNLPPSHAFEPGCCKFVKAHPVHAQPEGQQ